MICKNYENLNVVERNTMIGQLMHLVQSNDIYFNHAERMIMKGQAEGLLDNITILPEPIPQPIEENE